MSDETGQVKLLPCPSCGRWDIVPFQRYHHFRYFCDHCGFSTGKHVSLSAAKESWNTRAVVKESLSTGDREKVMKAVQLIADFTWSNIGRNLVCRQCQGHSAHSKE